MSPSYSVSYTSRACNTAWSCAYLVLLKCLLKAVITFDGLVASGSGSASAPNIACLTFANALCNGTLSCWSNINRSVYAPIAAPGARPCVNLPIPFAPATPNAPTPSNSATPFTRSIGIITLLR